MQDLIEYIDGNLSRKRLEQLTTSIIEAYKSEDDVTLKAAAETLSIDTSGERKRLFYRLVREFHPDRLKLLRADFEKAAGGSDRTALERLGRMLDLKLHVGTIRRERYDFEYAEVFRGGADASMGFMEDDSWQPDDEGSFYDAVKREIFGNQNFHIDPADLGQIDGVLNLQDYNLDDLDGIEYCRNVRILNICGNDISSLYDLQFLNQLEELYASGNRITGIEGLSELPALEIADLSDNDIEDASPLLALPKLKFVDLRSNPVAGQDIIRELSARGVTVLL